MYSLLLVDDEVNILNGLYQNVGWADIGISTVHKASSALEAVEIINHEHIDLVITDIRMHEMDGIELAAFVRKNWPFTKIIFLTGYQEFTYAHAAVTLGVFRYMLKPVSYTDLQECARQALEELASELSKILLMKDMEHTIEEQRPVMRERMIRNWLVWGNMNLLEDASLLEEYGLPLRRTDQGFMVAVKLLDVDLWSEDAYIRHIKIRQSARSILACEARMLDYFTSEGTTVLIFLTDEAQDHSRVQAKVVACLEEFQHAIYEALGLQSNIFWTHMADMDRMPKAYADLKQRISQYIALVPHCIIGPERENANSAIYMESLQMKPRLSKLIASLDRDQVQQRIDLIFAELQRLESNRIVMLQVYHEITGALITDSLSRGVALQAWVGDDWEFFESFAGLQTIDHLYAAARRVTTQYMDFIHNNGITQTQSMIAAVKDTVQENLAENISVASLAQQFAYHPNYLSQVFRHEEGMSLQEYIIETRISTAKRLLLQGISVGDVATRVGYGNNITHFSRIFKKVVGMSPKQYQQSE